MFHAKLNLLNTSKGTAKGNDDNEVSSTDSYDSSDSIRNNSRHLPVVIIDLKEKEIIQCESESIEDLVDGLCNVINVNDSIDKALVIFGTQNFLPDINSDEALTNFLLIFSHLSLIFNVAHDEYSK